MTELGNLMAGILLSPRRMSTVKIRAGSLFCTPMSRIGAWEAGFGLASKCGKLAGSTQSAKTQAGSCFPPSSTAATAAAQVVHRQPQFRTCGKLASGCKVG